MMKMYNVTCYSRIYKVKLNDSFFFVRDEQSKRLESCRPFFRRTKNEFARHQAIIRFAFVK